MSCDYLKLMHSSVILINTSNKHNKMNLKKKFLS